MSKNDQDETIDKRTSAKEGLDNLTADICVQFPSLSSSSSMETEEKIKLQSIVKEYLELNDTLRKRNVTMREHITAFEKQHEYMPILEHRRIVKDLEEKLSENVEVIQANSKEVKKLKDYIEKNEIENAVEKEGNKLKIEYEYVPILEHRRIVKDLEEKLSENFVKNLELDEMIQANSKEVKKLKDYIEKNEIENAAEKKSNKLKIEHEYVPILEHRRIVKDLEEKLSENVEEIQANSKEVKKLKDYIEKTEIENAAEKDNKLDIENEYVPILEHRRIVKDLEEKLSENVEVIQANSKEVKKLKDYIEKTEIENAAEINNKLDIENEYVPILEHRRIVKDLEEKLSENVEVIQANSKEVKKLKDYIEKKEIENAAENKSNNLESEHEYVLILEHRRIIKDLEDKLSENVEVIQANSKEVKKLEDYIKKTEIENAAEKKSIKLEIENEYVPILEHRKIVRDLEEKLSETFVKNLELDEMVINNCVKIQANSKEVKKLKDYIEKTEIENAAEKKNIKLEIENEYVPILEHRKIVKDLEEKLSENFVKNLELDEMIRANSKEVKKLKENKMEETEIENAESNKLNIEHEDVPNIGRRVGFRRIGFKIKDLEEKLSENVEVIQANSKEVKKLKDYIEKNKIENAEEKEGNKLKIEHEYVPILEHRKIVKDLEKEKLSENVEVIQAHSKEEIENAEKKKSDGIRDLVLMYEKNSSKYWK